MEEVLSSDFLYVIRTDDVKFRSHRLFLTGKLTHLISHKLIDHIQHAVFVIGFGDEISRFFYKALYAIGMDWGMEELLPVVMEVGEVNLISNTLPGTGCSDL